MLDSPWLLPLAGLLAGIVLGAVARRSHFCTLSALERHWYAGDSTGLRCWALAATTALLLTQALLLTGVIDLSDSFYLSPAFGLTGAVLGGVAFGVGMALVGTCGLGAVIRLGGGSLRSLVVLVVLGLTALAAQRGLVAQLRVIVVDDLAIDLSAAGTQAMPDLADHWLGPAAGMLVRLLVPALLLTWVLGDPAFRRQRGKILAGVAVGAVIAFGWLATEIAAAHAFVPVQREAGSFVVPVGDLILQVITFTGVLPDYGVGLIVGTLIGAALAAWQQADVRWEACDDARELRRHLLGAVLMGIGGVFAMGCTVGQGITAFSTMAISAPIVVLAIMAGARLGLAWLLEGSVRHLFMPQGAGSVSKG